MAAWQGFWVVKVAVPSFVVTLSGLLAFRGIGYYVSDARTIAPSPNPSASSARAFIPPTASYVVLFVVYAIAAAALIWRQRRGRQEGSDEARRQAHNFGGVGSFARLDLRRLSRHPVRVALGRRNRDPSHHPDGSHEIRPQHLSHWIESRGCVASRHSAWRDTCS